MRFAIGTVQHALFAITLGTFLCQTIHAQEREDLLAAFEDTNVVTGTWIVREGELVSNDERGARLILSGRTPESYSVNVEFTRVAGTNAIGVVLPVADRQCAFLLSVFDGEAHGIGVIDNQLARSNPSTQKPGQLENDHAYRLLIEVDVQGNQASISSTLDGRDGPGWKGNVNALSMKEFWKLREPTNLGLCTYSPTVFHRITIQPLDRTMRMTSPVERSSEQLAGNPNDSVGEATRLLYTVAHGEPSSQRLSPLFREQQIQAVSSNTSLTSELLSTYDILFIRAPRQRIAETETRAIAEFVRNGGSLLLVMDEERRTSLATTGVNSIAAEFGASFTEDTPYLHNCGAVGVKGTIHADRREVPLSGARSITGGTPFGFALDKENEQGAVFASAVEVEDGGRLILLSDGMAAGLMGTAQGQRLTGVPRDPAQTTYWGKDSKLFLSEVLAWLSRKTP